MNVRPGEERATIGKQLERGVWSVESEGEIQTQRKRIQSRDGLTWSVISGRMDLTQRWR